MLEAAPGDEAKKRKGGEPVTAGPPIPGGVHQVFPGFPMYLPPSPNFFPFWFNPFSWQVPRHNFGAFGPGGPVDQGACGRSTFGQQLVSSSYGGWQHLSSVPPPQQVAMDAFGCGNPQHLQVGLRGGNLAGNQGSVASAQSLSSHACQSPPPYPVATGYYPLPPISAISPMCARQEEEVPIANEPQVRGGAGLLPHPYLPASGNSDRANQSVHKRHQETLRSSEKHPQGSASIPANGTSTYRHNPYVVQGGNLVSVENSLPLGGRHDSTSETPATHQSAGTTQETDAIGHLPDLEGKPRGVSPSRPHRLDLGLQGDSTVRPRSSTPESGGVRHQGQTVDGANIPASGSDSPRVSSAVPASRRHLQQEVITSLNQNGSSRLPLAGSGERHPQPTASHNVVEAHEFTSAGDPSLRNGLLPPALPPSSSPRHGCVHPVLGSGSEILERSSWEGIDRASYSQFDGGQWFDQSTKDSTLPLHAPQVPLAHLTVFDSLAQDVPKRAQLMWQSARKWLSAEPFKRVEAQWLKDHERKQRFSDFVTDDVNALISAKIVEPAPRSGNLFLGSQFTVDELSKSRRRPIMACFNTNDMIKTFFTEKELTLPTIQQQQQQLLAVPGRVKALCFDLKASFFQFEVHPEARRFFAFKTRHGTYQYTRLPMGFTRSCDVLQAAVTILAEAAIARLPAEAAVSYLVYIDNVRFIVDENHAAAMGNAFHNVCKEANVTLNDELLNTPHFQGEFLSQGYNTIDKSAWIAKKQQPKLRDAIEVISADKSTWKSSRAAFGRIFWAMEVAGIQWGRFFRVKDFYRRKCAEFSAGKFSEHALTPLWPSAREEFSQLSALITGPSAKVRWSILPEEPEMILFTDASSSGCGAVLTVKSARAKTFKATWTEDEKLLPINVLEAIATCRALQTFSEDVRGKDLQLVIDNAAERFCLQKGESKSFLLNTHVTAILKRLTVCPSWSVTAIESAKNPADEPSRGTATDQKKVKEAIADSRRSGVVFRHVRC